MLSPLHFLDINRAISIHVVHFEGPLELLLGGPLGGDVKSQQKLPEVNRAAPISVKCPDNSLAHSSILNIL